jgi:PIN domain nuclease of toxin-antitoxin system
MAATMLLLDTHVVLWVLDDSPRLGAKAKALITSATRVHASAATVWELTIKAMLGKLTVPGDLARTLPAQGLVLLDITAEDAQAVRAYPELARHDPFDRLLVVQAERADLTFLTADKVLLGLDRAFIRDATQ